MFHWDFTLAAASEATPEDLSAAGFGAHFPTQADAEAWLGESFADLQDYGVESVSLIRGEDVVYGPMGLDPA